MELSEYLRLLLRSWVFILVWTLIGAGIALGYLLTQPVLYSAKASTFISISSARDVNTLAQGSAFAKDAAIDFAEIAQSPYVLSEVRRELNLTTTAEELSTRVRADVVPNSSIITVTASATEPSLASALANAVTVQLADSVAKLNPNAGNAQSVARATIIARATTPSGPSSPAVELDVAIGVLAGFALGVLLVLLRESLDQRIRTPTQLTRVARAPLLGTVPQPAEQSVGERLTNQKVAPFRPIRDEVLEGPSQKRVVTISSVISGDSTASLAASLAGSIALTGSTALLVDATSRTGAAAALFGASMQPGLTEVLERRKTLQASVVAGPVEGLWYLPPGATTGREEDLIASPEMTDALEEMIGRFDAVVINTDPVADSSTARVLGRQADGVIVACLLDRASAPEVRRAVEAVERGGARLLGTVLVTRPGRASRRDRKAAAGPKQPNPRQQGPKPQNPKPPKRTRSTPPQQGPAS